MAEAGKVVAYAWSEHLEYTPSSPGNAAVHGKANAEGMHVGVTVDATTLPNASPPAEEAH